ncbi:hypothetical protein [Geminisphaera colitermitum]|uniref:hypothetical protein n=1 Tax=Geminisphaera colitermitum TaxID=1148786 RepID=UPI0018E324EA|nr:hypothetical protein [Geminisphaera colitermitum]
MRVLSVFLVATLIAIGMGGCETKTKEDSSIPWSRPASWEGQMPGMGGFGGYR